MTKPNIDKQALDAAALVKATAETTATALNIQYIQRDILEIKTAIKDMTTTYVKQDEHAEVLKVQADHEARTRVLEIGQTKIMTYGAAALVAISVIEVLVTHYLK